MGFYEGAMHFVTNGHGEREGAPLSYPRGPPVERNRGYGSGKASLIPRARHVKK